MTAEEIVNELGNTNKHESLFWKLTGLMDENMVDEANLCIQKSFNCDKETANLVYIGFKEQFYYGGYGEDMTPEGSTEYNKEIVLNIPKCPICQSTNLKKISGWSKSMSTMVWGVFAAGRVSKTWHCNNCDSEW